MGKGGCHDLSSQLRAGWHGRRWRMLHVRAANRPANPPPTITTRREPDVAAMAHPDLRYLVRSSGALMVMMSTRKPAGIAPMWVLPALACPRHSGRGFLRTTTERGPTVMWSPALRSAAAWPGAGSWVSISACHVAWGLVAGSAKSSGCHH